MSETQRADSSGLPLVVLLGPTAAGKTRLSTNLAEQIGGEIVGADSRQVYRGMDIGTAKVTQAEKRAVPHHLLDVVDPSGPFGLADYLDLAAEAIAGIRARGRIPILVGGSGQYIWAVAEGWNVPRVAPDLELRAALAEQARVDGPLRLHDQLASADPEAARAIHPNNVRRVVRALELAAATSRLPSSLRGNRTPPRGVILLGLTPPREELRARIDLRVDEMFQRGLIAETEGLLRRGYNRSLPSMSGIGYTQVVQLLLGELTLPEAIAHVKTATHRLARQQSAWFRATDVRIAWLPGPEVVAAAAIIHRLSGRQAGSPLRGEVA